MAVSPLQAIMQARATVAAQAARVAAVPAPAPSPVVRALNLGAAPAPAAPAPQKRVVAVHLQPTSDAATNPNNAANLIASIMKTNPGVNPNVAAKAAISGQLHADNFPPQGGTLHVDTQTGNVTPQPLGTPADAPHDAAISAAPNYKSLLLPAGAGAAAGAAIGSAVPVLGNIGGAVVGGLVGALLGYKKMKQGG